MYLTCVSLCLFFGNPFELCKLFCIFFAGAIAATGAATLTVAAATAVAANAAMLVRVPHNQARAPKHNNRTNNGSRLKFVAKKSIIAKHLSYKRNIKLSVITWKQQPS